MKKIFIVCFAFLITQGLSFADEIIDASGNISPCRIETVSGGLIEYKKDGNLYSFQREKDSLIFNDYVDVRTKFLKGKTIQRITGKIIAKDFDGLKIRNENGDMYVPLYRVKFIGIYKP